MTIQLKKIDQIFKEYLSEAEIAEADQEAQQELETLKILQEDVGVGAV